MATIGARRSLPCAPVTHWLALGLARSDIMPTFRARFSRAITHLYCRHSDRSAPASAHALPAAHQRTSLRCPRSSRMAPPPVAADPAPRLPTHPCHCPVRADGVRPRVSRASRDHVGQHGQPHARAARRNGLGRRGACRQVMLYAMLLCYTPCYYVIPMLCLVVQTPSHFGVTNVITRHNTA